MISPNMNSAKVNSAIFRLLCAEILLQGTAFTFHSLNHRTNWVWRALKQKWLGILSDFVWHQK